MTCRNLYTKVDILLGHQYLKVISGQIHSLSEYKGNITNIFPTLSVDEMKLKIFNET